MTLIARRTANSSFEMGRLPRLIIRVGATSFLFLLFALEAFTLPFGTKNGEIAFVQMHPRGLHIDITAIIASVTLMPSLFFMSRGKTSRIASLIFSASAGESGKKKSQ
jgi:hypothetical protein